MADAYARANADRRSLYRLYIYIYNRIYIYTHIYIRHFLHLVRTLHIVKGEAGRGGEGYDRIVITIVDNATLPEHCMLPARGARRAFN